MAIFNALSRMEILRDVHTLILDGLSVTSELVREIICEESFNVRVLSIREVQNLNERKLQQALRYSIRPSRAANTPKLEALYIFGPRDAPSSPRMKRHLAPGSSTIASPQTLASHGGVMSSRGAQIGAQWNEMSENALAHDLEKSGDKWYEKSGILFAKPISSEWADTVLSCQGIVSFDAILCNGPRHHSREASANGHNEGSPIPPYRRALAYLPPRLATYSTGGCCKCGSAPEGFSLYGKSSLEALPLLAPPPLHNSSAKSAKVPTIRGSEIKKLLVRCVDCIRARYCEGCHKWWCEDCYEIPEVAVTPVESLQPWEAVGSNLGGQPEKNVKPRVRRSCFECGLTGAQKAAEEQERCTDLVMETFERTSLVITTPAYYFFISVITEYYVFQDIVCVACI
ncbi:hypothetical protein GLAREA_00010 [Glarea lozoyensis ATCC 20868]|uniref:Uncharacterized protein n=1 Tax=Glarea lozoyensis (strain ATCC 20868 / MF5171) TaxID=1116229 RepID=S3CQY9_GLAL2|nr:uncharacterized protein GLAREA_00010 [Glarea lozoyensis ATCC 20868]EPE28852.1 hypothetical protein GLAREA_00010 [Glarea lozoyensis ATCC 20868]